MSSNEQRNGALLGLAAYLLWGVFPIYFKMVAEVPPFEVLAHRIVWSFALLVPLVAWRREWGPVLKALKTRRTVTLLVCSTSFILCNWFTFIYAISTGQVLQSSLGYFINPLVSVLCGFLFLGERLTGFQRLSIGLAVAGVVIQTWLVGELPLISLVLAFSFGLYGLLRKILRIEPFVGDGAGYPGGAGVPRNAQ